MDTNKKTFRLLKRVSSSFSAVVTGFSVVTTLLFRIRDKINLTFIMNLTQKISSTIGIKKVRFNFISKLTEKPAITINSKRIKITYSIKERIKFILTMLMRVRIIWNMKMIQKANTNLGIKKVKITFNPSVFEFYKLLLFDPQTLLILDAETVGEMDYAGWVP